MFHIYFVVRLQKVWKKLISKFQCTSHHILDDIFVFGEAVEGVSVTPESIRRLLLVDGVSGENKFLFLD
jgi:hypothetical protein